MKSLQLDIVSSLFAPPTGRRVANNSACHLVGAVFVLLTLNGCFPDDQQRADAAGDTNAQAADMDAPALVDQVSEDDSGDVAGDTSGSTDNSDSVVSDVGEDEVDSVKVDTLEVTTSDTEITVTGCAAAGSDGDACDDEDPCTVGDHCEAGACVGGPHPDDSALDWVLAFGDGAFVPTSLVVDRSGAPVIAGILDLDGGEIDASTGMMTFAAVASTDRVFLTRIASTGETAISAVAVSGSLGNGQAPFAAAGTYQDSLSHELLLMPKAGVVHVESSSGEQVEVGIANDTFMQVQLRTNGTFHNNALPWSMESPGSLQAGATARIGDQKWLAMVSTSRTVMVPGPSLPTEFSNTEWTPEGPNSRSFAVRLSSRASTAAAEVLVDLNALAPLGVIPDPVAVGYGFGVAAILLTDSEIETTAGSQLVSAFSALTLLSFGSDGLLETDPLNAGVTLMDEVNGDDLKPDFLFQGFFPRVLPRADGGFFVATRLYGTRTFGKAPNSRSVTPTHPTFAVASFEVGGRLSWVRTIELPTSNDPFDVSFGWAPLAFLGRADGSFVVGGGLDQMLTFETADGSSKALDSSDASRDGFVAIWDRVGRLVLAERVAPGPGPGMVTALGEDIDGSLLVAGQAEGPTTIGVGTGAGIVSGQSGTVGFVARLNSAGGLDCW